MADRENAYYQRLANRITHCDLAPSSSDVDFVYSEFAESSRNMSRPYDQGLFNRPVIESCNQEFGYDNYIWRAHFGHWSSSVDGPTSMADRKNAYYQHLVNRITRCDLALSSSANILDWIENLRWIGTKLRRCNQGWLYRQVTERCNKEFGRDSIFRDLALRHLLPHEYLLATEINEYLSKNDLKHATEKICSLYSSEIQQIKRIYPSLFGRELEDDLETFTFGNHRELLRKLISVPHGNAGVGEERLENIVRYMHEKLQETYKCPGLAIMDLVYELNEEDLRIVVDRYSTKYRKSLVEDLMLAGYGHFVHGLITKIQCAMNRPKYHAEKLYKAFGEMRDPNIEGMIDADHHIDYETIVRVITTVADRDMMMMKEEYRKKSGRALENDISEAFVDRQDCLQLILMILNGDILSLNQEYERIRNRATQNDRGLYYREAIESCSQQYGGAYYFRDLVLRQLLPREYYLATSINNAFEGKCLIKATEEICSLRSSEIPRIKESYSSLFGRELKDDIEDYTFGDHRKLLLQGVEPISIGNKIEKQCLEKIVRFLHEKVLENLKRPKMAIASQVCGLSEEDLRVVADGYHKKYGRFLEEDLTLAGYGHVEHGLVTKIECARNRPEYFAEKLCEAMIDPYTRAMRDIDQIDRETIVSVITTVAEIDMMPMKEEYRQKSGCALEDDISVAFADRQDCWQLILLILNPNSATN